MDIKQMQYFVSIAQEGSYSRAAEKLSVSQPALSIAIKKLEEEFGVKLFYYFDRRTFPIVRRVFFWAILFQIFPRPIPISRSI